MKKNYAKKAAWMALCAAFLALAADAAALIATGEGFFAEALNPLLLAVVALAAVAYALRIFPFSGAKTALGALLVIGILWLALSAVFTRSPPIHYVASCSMLPEFTRGDALLVLPLAPDVETLGVNESLEEQRPWTVTYENGAMEINESMNSYCDNRPDDICVLFFRFPQNFSEKNGPVTYNYSNCMRKLAVGEKSVPCVSSATVGNRTFYTSDRRDGLVVFATRVSEHAPIQIAHRAFFGLRDDGGRVFYFTKGDGNPVFDSQSKGYYANNGAMATSASEVRGSVIFKIPFLGDLGRRLYPVPDCENETLVVS